MAPSPETINFLKEKQNILTQTNIPNGEEVNEDLILSRIHEIDFQTLVLAGKKMVFCGIKMDTGFVITGDPAICYGQPSENDRIEKEVAYHNAYSKLLELEAYRQGSTADESTLTNRIEVLQDELTEAVDHIEQSGADWAEIRMNSLEEQ